MLKGKAMINRFTGYVWAAPVFARALCISMGTLVLASVFSHAAEDVSGNQNTGEGGTAVNAFEQVKDLDWQEVLDDDGRGDWREKWFLDGDKARVVNTPEGMILVAGPTPDDDASHAVLWTKDAYQGDVKIEYDYTRLEESDRGVNILYLLATGSGEPSYPKDITEWNETRRVPTMGKYFQNMNLYHISYAAATYPVDPEGEGDYVRARRYMPAGGTLRGTDLEPDYRKTGFFRKNVPHRITVIKSGDWLFMNVKNAEKEQLFAWKTDGFPGVTEGRIGFRQMFTRISRYANIRISLRKD